MAQPLWIETEIGNQAFTLLNLDHPEVASQVFGEMEDGIDVYYDCRWGVTHHLVSYLLTEPHWLTEKNALILGAGVGCETLLAARQCRKLYLNDLAPKSLELCAKQLKQNGASNFSMLPGRYEELALPKVDLVLGSFLVYNAETLSAMQAFLQKWDGEMLLMNETLKPFQRLLKSVERPIEVLFEEEGAQCIHFPSR